MNANRTHLQLDADRTVLSPPDSTQVAIAVGIDRLANEVFRDDPPSAVELERGITVIEDALMDAGPTTPRANSLRPTLTCNG